VYQDRVFRGSAAPKQAAARDTLVDLCTAQKRRDGQQPLLTLSQYGIGLDAGQQRLKVDQQHLTDRIVKSDKQQASVAQQLQQSSSGQNQIKAALRNMQKQVTGLESGQGKLQQEVTDLGQVMEQMKGRKGPALPWQRAQEQVVLIPLLFILLFLGVIACLREKMLSIMPSFNNSPGGKISQTDMCHISDNVSCCVVDANGMQGNVKAMMMLLVLCSVPHRGKDSYTAHICSVFRS